MTARRLAVAAWRVFRTDQAGSLLDTLLTEQQQDGILPASPGGVSGWRSAQTASCWPPPAATARCGCGTRSPAARRRALRATTGHTGVGVAAVAFSPGGSCWPAPADGTVRLWDPVTGGPVARTRSTPATPRRRERGGVQPGRRAAGQRRRGRHGAVVGSGHRPPRRRTPGRHAAAPAWGGRGGVQPGRASCWPAPAATARCGCGIRPPAAPSAPRCRPHRRGAAWRGGVRPDGRAAGQRRRRRHGAVVGSGHRPARSAPLDGHTGCGAGVAGVAFARTGGLLACAGDDGTVRLWDPVTGRPVGDPLTGHTGSVNAVAFGPLPMGGRCWPARGDDGTVRLWDPVTGGRSAPADRPHRLGAAWRRWRSPGRRSCWPAPAATARCGCGIRSPAGRSATRCTGHTGSVLRVAAVALPGRQLLACAGDDGTVRLWDPVTGRRSGPSGRTGHADCGEPAVAAVPFARTAGCWPAPASTARCGCGTRSPAPRRRAPPGRSSADSGVSAVAFSPDGCCWPAAATTARSGCGIRSLAGRPSRRCGPLPQWMPTAGY